MSGIVLSASVRQNLLSLQSTASLLATTQNDLATGNKVNSALDNPTNYFTAQGLNNRASDISNLLDAIGNGVQVLQAANTGITSLQSLVDSAKSIANQVLQSPVGYSTKSNVISTAIAGANANNLLGTSQNSTVTGSAIQNDNTSTAVAITTATQLVGTAGTGSNDLATAITNNSTLTIDGKTITFSTGQTTITSDGQNDYTIGIGAGSTLTVGNVLSTIDAITGASTASTISSGKLVLSTGTTQNLVIGGSGNALAELGLGSVSATTSRDQHHLRNRHRRDLHAEPAQHGAVGEQPAGEHRHHRQDQHHDHERCGVLYGRRPRRFIGHRFNVAVLPAGGCGAGCGPELASAACKPGGAVQ
jgi:flagellin